PTKPRLASDLEGSDWIGKGQCVIDIPPTSGDEECLYWIRFLTYHMAKANLSQELYSLMFSLDWVSIKARIMGPAPLINDYVEHGSILDKENSDVRCQFQEFLSQSAHHLEQRPFPDVVQLALSQPHTSEVYRQARQQALNRAKGGKLYFDLINKRSVESLSYLVIHPHQGFIYSACFSHDGTKVASCGASKTLKVFKSTSGEKLAEIQAHEEEVLCCAFTYDDRLIATCSSDRKVKVWNAEQGKLLRAFAEEHEEQVNHCEFTNTDFLKLLLFLLFLALIHVSHISLPFVFYLSTSCNDGTVKLFQVSSANEWKTIDVRSMFADGEEVIVKCSTWSPDSKRVICAARNAVLVFDVESSDMLLEIRTNRLSMVQYCHACPTSNLLAIAFSNYALELWDLENSKKKADCSGHLSWVQRVQFSNDGSKLLSCSDDQTSSFALLVLDSDVLFNNEEIIVSAADNCNRLQVRDGRTSSVLFQSEEMLSRIRCTCLSRHPSAVALGQESGSVQVRLHTRAQLTDFNGFPTHFDDAVVDWSVCGSLQVWKWQSGECTVLQGHKEQVRCFSLLSDSMNDSSLLSWSFDGTVKVWDIERGERLQDIQAHQGAILSCHVSPDRCLFATTSADKTAKLWSIPSWQCTHTLRGHQECVRSCRFSWDSRRLATGDDNGEIRLWSVEDGSLLKICSRDGKGGMDSLHGGWVSDLHFSPDDSLLVSAGGYIKWWSVVTGEALQTFYPTGSALKKIHVSPDFSTFVTIDNIGILYILQRVV
uniref:Apoptotic peptidase activating factor 1 n=1 Tax=Nothobranchius furzeri TaxID=105023 RepID=A0A8C6LZF9_NOTFU